jgi:hypothetical protein
MASTSSIAKTGPAPATGGRPAELEDWLNRYIYHPLAERLAEALEPTGISPNAVSIAGALSIWIAACAYFALPWPVGAALGLAFHMLWHVIDGADGDLARRTGKASPHGEMVDGLCDYGGHSLLYFALAAMLDDQIGLWAWPWGILAAASHAVQTNHAETQRRTYLWWAYGRPWLKHAQARGDELFNATSWPRRISTWLARTYLGVAASMNPHSAGVDRAIQIAAGDSRRTELIRRIVRRAWRRSISLEMAVGPNPRTIILGASMALGSPIWFFLAETVLLNLLLLVSVVHHNAVARRLAEKLGTVRT